MKKSKLTSALAFAIGFGAVQMANADAVYKDWMQYNFDNKTVAMTYSEKDENNVIGISFRPDSQCAAHLIFCRKIDDGLDIPHTQVTLSDDGSELLLRVDEGKTKVLDFATISANGEYFYVEIGLGGDDGDEFLGDMLYGNKLRVHNRQINKTDRFSLRGSKAAILSAYNNCINMPEMTDPDADYFTASDVKADPDTKYF